MVFFLSSRSFFCRATWPSSLSLIASSPKPSIREALDRTVDELELHPLEPCAADLAHQAPAEQAPFRDGLGHSGSSPAYRFSDADQPVFEICLVRQVRQRPGLQGFDLLDDRERLALHPLLRPLASPNLHERLPLGAVLPDARLPSLGDPEGVRHHAV